MIVILCRLTLFVIYDHCNGERNLVTHELVRMAKISPPNLWMETFPDAVIPVIVNGATVLRNE